MADTNMYNFGRSYSCQPAQVRDTIITISNSGTDEITIKTPQLGSPYTLLEPPA